MHDASVNRERHMYTSSKNYILRKKQTSEILTSGIAMVRMLQSYSRQTVRSAHCQQ